MVDRCFVSSYFDERIGDFHSSSSLPLTRSTVTGSDRGLLPTFEVFPWTGSNHTLERLTEGSIRFVTDRPGNVDEFPVLLFE